MTENSLSDKAAIRELVAPIDELNLATEGLAVASVFRFMDLPAELRLVIYEVLLKVNHMIQPPGFPRSKDSFSIPRLDFLPRPSLAIEILQVNRQIHAEAIEVLYGTNIFQFEFPNDSAWSHMTNIFLKRIGPSNRSRINKAGLFFAPIYYIIPNHKYKFPRRSIRSFSNVREVNLMVAKTEALDESCRRKGDKDYLRTTVESLRRHLPEGCMLRWDVSGNTELEGTLRGVYGEGGYLTVETETKKMMLNGVKAVWDNWDAYTPTYRFRHIASLSADVVGIVK